MSKKVAIIGTGPAGMAAAQSLVNEGYKVTMYDKADRPGGILMYGIPHMKLNKNNVIKKAQVLKDKGVEFILNTKVSKKDVAESISKDFDAVLLATGAEQPRDLNIDGRQLKNIHFAMEYLTDNTKHLLDGTPLTINAKDKNVVIIGGGDTANDCCATAISQGAKHVRMLEMTSKDNTRKKAYYDFDEDEIRLYEKTAVKFVDCDGNVSKIVTDDVQVVRDENGTRINFQNQKAELDADLVLVAIGFLGPVEEALDAFDIQLDREQHNRDTTIFTTDKENIFICGDARRGQSLIKWAIQEGKLAAVAIQKYLQ